MARKLHLCSRLKLVGAGHALHWDDLTHLEHGIGQLVKISTTHDVYSCVMDADLNSLEIVWEVCRCLHSIARDTLCPGIIEEEPLRVLLHDINHQVTDRHHWLAAS